MNIYEHAVKEWGVVSQMLKAIQECSELINSITRLIEGRDDKNDVASEVADVEIMCEQLRIMVGADKVDREKKLKLERLELILKGDRL